MFVFSRQSRRNKVGTWDCSRDQERLLLVILWLITGGKENVYCEKRKLGTENPGLYWRVEFQQFQNCFCFCTNSSRIDLRFITWKKDDHAETESSRNVSPSNHKGCLIFLKGTSLCSSTSGSSRYGAMSSRVLRLRVLWRMCYRGTASVK